MGFLDRKNRVLDVVLTEEGRRQLALGELEFAFFSLHDDGIDYDPTISESGSLDEQALTARRIELIESTPCLEATIVPNDRKLNRSAGGQPSSFLYQAADRYTRLPAPSIVPSASLAIEASQARDGDLYERTSQTSAVVSLRYVGDIDQAATKEFTVRVMGSSSDGLEALPKRADLDGRPSFGPFVVVIPDAEVGKRR